MDAHNSFNEGKIAGVISRTASEQVEIERTEAELASRQPEIQAAIASKTAADRAAAARKEEASLLRYIHVHIIFIFI